MHATQRSCDVPLGLNFNMVQVYTFLALMAQITGNKPGIAYHKIVNAHVYEDQYELFNEQCARDPMPHATFHINPELNSLDALMNENLVVEENFKVCNYNHHDAIKYPFSV
ncbi:Thymidylate synthase [Vibrio phage 70E38.1]|nr:Thymidylate synthase [Vibrio phage 70E38.1]